MNVVFLDIDGVINTPMWHQNGRKILRPTYNFPEDGKTNNWQTCQWVSEFCQQYGYSIVVSSTWRIGLGIDRLREILYNSGIREKIEIVGKTPMLYKERGYEIRDWLEKNGEKYDVKRVIIFDDDADMVYPELMSRLVRTPEGSGFLMESFKEASRLHKENPKWVGFPSKPEQLSFWTMPILTDEYEEIS